MIIEHIGVIDTKVQFIQVANYSAIKTISLYYYPVKPAIDKYCVAVFKIKLKQKK